MMLPTHVMASIVLFLLVSPNFVSPSVLPFFIVGALLPDLDIKLIHRRSLHFPFIYPIIAVIMYFSSFYHLSALFISASLHCVMEIAGNDAGEFVEREKGALYNHLTREWISGFCWIKEDGGFRDLLVLSILSGISLIISSSLVIGLITALSVISGLTYYTIRDRVEEIFPDILLTKP
jgi:hypothetical protein